MRDNPSTGRRICIVSPGNLASNPRVVKEAGALQDAGYAVTAVVCNYSPELKPADDEIASRVAWRVVHVPRPMGEGALTWLARRVARLWASAGASVPPWLAAYAAGGPISTLRRAADAVPADLYIAHYIAGLAAAAPVARERGALLAFDAEDFHSGEGTSGPDEAFRMKMIATIERAALASCVYVTAAAPLIAGAYAAAYGVAVTSVLNVFPFDMAPAAPFSPEASGGPPRLAAYWFSQTIGMDRGLQQFLEAMALAKCRVTLDVRGGNRWGGGDRLMAVARDLGIADRVTILEKAPPDDMVMLSASYDIGLSLEMGETESRRFCLPNKIFTYLLAGVPVVLSDTAAQRALALDLGPAAVVVPLSDPAAIAAALDRLGKSPAALAEAKTAAWRLGRDRYNWDAEKDILLGVVARAFDRSAGPTAR